MQEIWRVPAAHLEQAQDDATLLAIRDMERAGIDIVTDGEMRRESYSNRFATALDGIDPDNPAEVIARARQADAGAPRRRADPAPRGRSRCATWNSCRPNTDRAGEDHPARPLHHVQQAQGRVLRRRRSSWRWTSPTR